MLFLIDFSLVDDCPTDHRNVKLKAIKQRFVLCSSSCETMSRPYFTARSATLVKEKIKL